MPSISSRQISGECSVISPFRYRKSSPFPFRPWCFGIPAFAIIAVVLLWSLTHLAAWIFAVLKLTK